MGSLGPGDSFSVLGVQLVRTEAEEGLDHFPNQRRWL